MSETAVVEQGRCPHCASEQLVGAEILDGWAEMAGWTRADDGTVEPAWTGSTRVLLDTSRPERPATPFYCTGCHAYLALAEIRFDAAGVAAS